MNATKHLWEVGHSYYCTEGQYFVNQLNHQTIYEFASFEAFLEEMGDADKDYNLLFRWDWEEGEEGEDYEERGSHLAPFNGDVHHKNAELKLFFMRQRKGFHSCCNVRVCRADEPAVIEYLRPHLAHLLELWAPLVPATPAA